MRRFNQVARKIITKGSKARNDSSTNGPACHDEKQTSEPSYLRIRHDAALRQVCATLINHRINSESHHQRCGGASFPSTTLCARSGEQRGSDVRKERNLQAVESNTIEHLKAELYGRYVYEEKQLQCRCTPRFRHVISTRSDVVWKRDYRSTASMGAVAQQML